MAIPKINNLPKHEVTIPSSGVKVKFRPYLVKEEKILLLAMESEDSQQTLNAVADTVLSCIEDDIDGDKLTTFDIEYLFTKIRAKSVGERSHLQIGCSGCKAPNDVTVNLDTIEMEVNRTNNVIKLSDEVSLKMCWPSYRRLANSEILNKAKSKTDQSFAILAYCIETIMFEDSQIVVREESDDDVNEFIDSLTSEQYKMVAKYLDDMPAMKHTIEFDCTHCGHKNTTKLQGITDFF